MLGLCDEEHEKATEPSPGAEGRDADAGQEYRNISQTPGLGRRFSWSRRKAGLGGRVSILGQQKGEQSVAPALWQRTHCTVSFSHPGHAHIQRGSM